MGVQTDNVQLRLTIDGVESGKTLRELRSEASALRSQLHNLRPDAEGFDAMIAKLHAVNGQIGEITSRFRPIQALPEQIQPALGSLAALSNEASELRKQIQTLAPTTDAFITASRRLSTVESEMRGVESAMRNINNVPLPANSLDALRAKLTELRSEWQRLDSTTAEYQNRSKEIHVVENQIKQLETAMRNIINVPLPANSLDALRQKLTELRAEFGRLDSTTAEYRHRANDIRQVEQQIQRLEGATRQSESGLGSFFNSLTNFVGRAMMLWYGLQQAFSVLWKPSELASQMESVRIAMETMLGSVSQAAKMTREIMVLAMNTPFETGELTEFVKRLLAMGVESKSVIKDITMLGDVAAGVGKEKLDRIVLAFGQVAAKTKLAGGELKQFVEAGVPLVGELAAMLKKSESEIYKMVEAGAIGFDKVEAAFARMTGEGGKFYNLMARQSQTLPGLLSTLSDHLKLSWAAFGDGFNVAMKEIVRSMIEVTKSMDRQAWQDFGTAVGNAVKFVVEFVPSLLRFTATFATFWTIMQVGTALIPLLTGSFTALSIAIATNPIGMIATVAGLAVTAVGALNDKMNALTDSQKALNEIRDNANQAASTEIEKANELFAVIQSVTASKDQKTAAYKRLQALHPNIMSQYASESDFLANLSAAHNKVTESILQQAFAKAKAAKMAEISGQMIDLEIKKADAKTELESQKAANQSVTHDLGDGMTMQTDNAANIAKAQQAHDELVRQGNEKIELFQKVSEASNVASQSAITSLSKLQTGLSRQAQEIEITKNRIKQDPKDESAKLHLAQLEKQHTSEIDHTVELNQKKKIISQESDKKAINAAKKASKDYLSELENATQEQINELTLKHLKSGKVEKDFDIELLQVKRDGLQKELNYAQGHTKELEHIATKKETEIIKIEKTIRDKRFSNEKEAIETSIQTRITESERTITNESTLKLSILEINRDKFTQLKALYEKEGKTTGNEYARVLLDIAKTERQITKETLDQRITDIKNSHTKELQTNENKYLQGQISEKAYQANVAKIQLDSLTAQLEALKASGQSETDAYRQLEINQLRAKKDFHDKQTALLLSSVNAMSEAELTALTDSFDKKRISQQQYELALLLDKKRMFAAQLELLRTAGQSETEVYKAIQKQLTGVITAEAKQRAAIAQADLKQKIQIGESGKDLLKGVIAFELQILQNKSKKAEADTKQDIAQKKKSTDTEIANLSRTEAEKKRNAVKIKALQDESAKYETEKLETLNKVKKEYAEKQRNMQRAQVVIDGVSEIAKIWLSYSATGPLAPILAGIQTAMAVARTATALSAIDGQAFARGGFTGSGTDWIDHTGFRVAGWVHQDEYVIPKRVLETPQGTVLAHTAERLRVGFADGGYTSLAPVLASQSVDFQGIETLLKQLITTVESRDNVLKAYIVTSELEAKQLRDRNDKKAAQWKL